MQLQKHFRSVCRLMQQLDVSVARWTKTLAASTAFSSRPQQLQLVAMIQHRTFMWSKFYRQKLKK